MALLLRSASSVAAAIVLLLLPHLVFAKPAPTTAPTTPVPSTHESVTQTRIERKTYDFKAAGKEMEYALFVPSTYHKGKKTPLVVALHGLYSNPQQILHYPGMTDLAEKYGYIVVGPMGYNSHGWYGAMPLVRGSKDDPKDLSELSEQDVMNVLDLVRKAYDIDPDRIYLLGHSMGGGGAWHLAIKHPELWAAVAPIAPATLRPATDLEKMKQVPVILVQGDKDVLVRVERVRPWADEMKKLNMQYEYVEVPGGDHIFTAFKCLPQVFAFFDKYTRGEKPKANGK